METENRKKKRGNRLGFIAIILGGLIPLLRNALEKKMPSWSPSDENIKWILFALFPALAIGAILFLRRKIEKGVDPGPSGNPAVKPYQPIEPK
jgi:hypothetical protein